MFNIHPILYDSDETDFVTGGIGSLEPRSCIVTEVRNGEYELEMDIDSLSPHFDCLKIGRLILAPHFPEAHDYMNYSDWEPFEIVEIEHDITHVAHIRAWHISYRLSKVAVLPFEVNVDPCAPYVIWQYADVYPATHGFTFRTDIHDDIDEYKLDQVITLRSFIGGEKNSLLDHFHGDLEWKRFTIWLHTPGSRGTESGVILKYGRNITELKRQQTAADAYSGVAPFWKGGNDGTGTIVTLPEKGVYINNALRDYYSSYLIVPLDMSSEFRTAPTVAQLRAAAEAYISANANTTIPENIDVSFIENPDFSDSRAKHLKLCDLLTVEYEDMGLSYTAMVTKTVYNVLLNRYDEISISTEPVTLNKAIKQVVKK